jgi:hypothetical protein
VAAAGSGAFEAAGLALPQPEIMKKTRHRLEGIDKTWISYIMGLWGEVGKNGSQGQTMKNSVRPERFGSFERRQCLPFLSFGQISLLDGGAVSVRGE